jgi:hypothetical protein
MNGAIIVESRNIPNLPSIIEGHMKYLKGWELTIYYGKDNEKILKNAFPDAKFNDYLLKFPPKDYCNDVLTSLKFWESIPYDKVLTFHSDSEILREGIEAFLEWDYVGSPWSHLMEGGNGGFSLRDKQKHIDLLKFKPWSKELGNEDEYFSKYLNEVGGKVAPRNICSLFGCETIYKLGTFGCHAIDKYLTKEECINIRTYQNNRLGFSLI